MKNETLLQDFLDGALPDNLQKELFEKLAQDETLRRDLKMNMSIENFARTDRANYKIPAELTQSVFSDLGITFPPQANSRNWKGIASVSLLILLAFLVAGGSYLAYHSYYSHPDGGNQLAKVKAHRSIAEVSSFAINSETSVINSDDNSLNGKSVSNVHTSYSSNTVSKISANAIKASKASSNSSLIANPSNSGLLAYAEELDKKSNKSDLQNEDLDNSINGASVERIDLVNSNISSVRTLDGYASDNGLLEHNFGGFNQPQLNGTLSLYPRSSMDPYRNAKWNLVLRKLPANKSLNPSLLQSNTNFLANTAIGASYNLSNDNSFGLEIGYENFSQQFTLQGGTLKYDQNPLMFWGGAFWGYTPAQLNIGGIVQPYSEIFCGGTSIGPLVKAQVGISVSLLKNIYLNIGSEYGILIYRVENNFYNSQNIGGTVGLRFSF